MEWTTYSDSSEWLNVSGELRKAEDAEAIAGIIATVRFLGQNGKPIKIVDIANAGFRLDVDGFSRFGQSFGVTPVDVTRYAIEVRVIR